MITREGKVTEMSYNRYPKEMKEAIIKRLISGEETVTDIQRETGVGINTLYRWRDKALNQKGLSATTKYKNADKWRSQDKFTVVLETANLSEIEFSEYCRNKGIYPEQVKEWREACINANDSKNEKNAKVSKELREERKRTEKLEKELNRKEKALAEAAALLVLRKKSRCDLGNEQRGRMISPSDREEAVKLSKDAVDSGAALYKACEELGSSKRTYNRWKKADSGYIDKRTICERPESANKLSQEERKKILEVMNSEEFSSKSPCEIVLILADRGEYLGSESTFYKVLKEEGMLVHRGRARKPHKRPISPHKALPLIRCGCGTSPT